MAFTPRGQEKPKKQKPKDKRKKLTIRECKEDQVRYHQLSRCTSDTQNKCTRVKRQRARLSSESRTQ